MSANLVSASAGATFSTYDRTATRLFVVVLAASFVAVAATVSVKSLAQEAPQRMQRVTFGALALDYDAGRWKLGAGHTRDALSLEGKLLGSDKARVTIAITQGTPCSVGTVVDRAATYPTLSSTRGSFQASTINPGGLMLHYATVGNRCRSLGGSPLFACVTHGGRTYMIDGLPVRNASNLCESPAHLDSIVLQMLNGLSIEQE